jgi:CHAT domain-containing protein
MGSQSRAREQPALVVGAEASEDGLLLATEAMELSLNADLTVLSACKTGTGELVTGEGVMGMSRAFLAAGSRAVLVSLWAVDSAATEVLMVAFSRARDGLVKQRRGGPHPCRWCED